MYRFKRQRASITISLVTLLIIGLIVGAVLFLFTGRTPAHKTLVGRPGTVPVTFSAKKKWPGAISSDYAWPLLSS